MQHTVLCNNSMLYYFIDLITVPSCQEDDAHNVQAVIDSLALDYLQVSLSHITGRYPELNGQ